MITRVRCTSVQDGWVTMFPVFTAGKAMIYPLSDFDRMDFVPQPGMVFDLGIEMVSTPLKGVVSSSLISVGNVRMPAKPSPLPSR